jgi:signal transduction histidine kinase
MATVFGREYNALNLLLIIVCYAGSLAIFPGLSFDYDPFFRWPEQFTTLLLLAFVSSVFSVLGPRRMFLVCLPTTFFFMIVLGIPLGKNLSIENLLLIPFCFTAMQRLGFPFSIFVAGAAIILVPVLKIPLPAFGHTISMPDTEQVVFYCLNNLALLLLLSISRRNSLLAEHTQDMVRRLQGAVDNLTKINKGYQNSSILTEEKSRREERHKISRDIHDVVGYTLTNLLMMAKTSLVLLPPESGNVARLLNDVIRLTQDGMADIRRSLYELQAQEMNQPAGLLAIHRLIDYFQEATGIEVVVDYANVPNTYGPRVNLFLFRMIQEGLINAFKHGQATRIEVIFWKSSEYVQVGIHDNGKGCPAVVKGIGLSGMEERVKSLGGQLEIGDRPSGFAVMAQIPLEQ